MSFFQPNLQLIQQLNMNDIRKARESRKKGNLIKPTINYIPSTLEKRAKKLVTKIQSNFKNDVKKVYHQSDQLTKVKISRESYQELAVVEANLLFENSVSNEHIAITNNINQLIKISLVNINEKDKLEEALGSDESEFRNPKKLLI
ncbi:hypothetical protein C1645_820245 [Glomus cerebriforme]|uniref:Uncharacterized protein n=1 Tax=Glomus cerebriforme TaxID=658196 RepID=A0A397T349_9GLOM|nr:hypothetical protein C1645_820245 [Glomus cerebriforme]